LSSNAPATSIKERCAQKKYDAVVIGSGPNGISAAIVLAQKSMSVLLVEGQRDLGGGCRSGQLTLPGFTHDICSSIYPLGMGSPFFRTLPLEEHGLSWINPEGTYAHPFDGGRAVVVERSVEASAKTMGPDALAYEKLVNALHINWDTLCESLLQPQKMLFHPFSMANFGLRALMSAKLFAQTTFKGELARGAFAGVAAHSTLPLSAATSAAFGLVLGVTSHPVGWPMPKGGAQKLSDALASYFTASGGEILLDAPVSSLDQLPPSKLVIADVTPWQLVSMAGSRLPGGYKKQLESYKYGPAVFKIDYALDAPIPWQAQGVDRAATVHLGGTIEEIDQSESGVWRGQHSERPYVLLAQHCLFDTTRAPEGKHTLWAYCHVPNGSTQDMSAQIENQIERFAPGFKKTIIAKSSISARGMEEHNANYIGGDINGGALIPSQLFTRPVFRLIPYSTPVEGLYLCSASTPPGGGVHGMGGYYAAHSAFRNWRA
jgi:phytoene dehydrogenase-like protein